MKRRFRLLPEPLGDEVRRELGRFGPAGSMAEIVKVWPAAVGEAIARNAWPARVGRDGTLYISTSSSAWAFELGLLERDIRERLSATLGPDAPSRLKFAPGRLPEPSSEDAEQGRKPPLEPSGAELAEAERLAATIEDENLRKVVAKAAAASLARASADRSF